MFYVPIAGNWFIWGFEKVAVAVLARLINAASILKDVHLEALSTLSLI